MREIESLFETYKNAVFQKDVEAYASIYDRQVLIFDMWEDWSSEGLPAWRQMAQDWFSNLGTDRVVVTFEDIRIQHYGELASATAFIKFAAISEKDEELRYLQNRLTWVLQKKENTWKIIHQHTSGPAEFETKKLILKK